MGEGDRRIMSSPKGERGSEESFLTPLVNSADCQRRDVIPSPGPGSTPRSPPSWRDQEYLPRKATWLHPHQMPELPKLAPFHAEEQRLYSESLPDG